MINYFFGQKIEQSQAFTNDGKRTPVTLIKAGVNYVVSIKKQNQDSSQMISLAFGPSE